MKVELELNGYLPAAERGDFSLRMILHGRRVCDARNAGLRGAACWRTSARRAGCRGGRAGRRLTDVVG